VYICVIFMGCISVIFVCVHVCDVHGVYICDIHVCICV